MKFVLQIEDAAGQVTELELKPGDRISLASAVKLLVTALEDVEGLELRGGDFVLQFNDGEVILADLTIEQQQALANQMGDFTTGSLGENDGSLVTLLELLDWTYGRGPFDFYDASRKTQQQVIFNTTEEFVPFDDRSDFVSDDENVESANVEGPIAMAPVLVGSLAPQSVAEDSSWNFTLPTGLFADSNGDVLTLTATLGDGSALPVWLSFNGTRFDGTPPANFNGPINIRIIAADPSGASASTVLTLEVTAVNDLPLSFDDELEVTEDTTLTFSAADLRGNDSDIDGDSLSIVLVGQPAHGRLVANLDGTFTYTPDANYAGPDSFTYRASDGTTSGNLVTVSITVGARDDAPVIGGTQTASIAEDSVTAATGTLTISDPDAGESSFVAQTATSGTYGSFSIDVSGSWTYQLNNGNPDIQALGVGDSLTETFPVSSVDGTTVQITVTINGTNDAPELSGSVSPQSVAEDMAWNFDLPTGLFGDVDGDALTITAVLADGSALPAWLSFDGTAFAGTPPANFNGTIDIRVIATDPSGAFVSTDFTLTVTATADAPVIGGTATGVVTEDGTATASGTLTITDPDAGESRFVAQAATSGTYGSFSIDASGNWTYQLNNASTAVQALTANDTRIDTFTVMSADGTTTQINVTVNGTNDVPTIGGTTTGVAREDTVTTASGVLTIADADAGQSSFLAQSGTRGTYGSFSVNTAGNWTYTLDNASTTVQSLAAGQTTTDTFTVMSADGTPTQVTVTITGTNDLPTIGGSLTGTATEDTALTATGTLTISDGDAGQSSFVAQAATRGTYGSFTLDTAGNWTYTLDNASTAVQSLWAGETRVETFFVRANDGTTRQVLVTVRGTSDAPVIDGTFTGSVTEDGATNIATGTLTVSDADAGQSSFIAQTATSGTYGSFSITTGGNWTYALNNASPAIQALTAGATRTDTFSVRSADGTARQVTVTITGSNDVPTITGTATGAITEDASSNIVSGNLTITDPDAGQSSFATQSGTAGTYGRFYINSTGRWDYVLNNSNTALQALTAGETRTETFTVTSQDSSATRTVEITITGTNDVPTISGSVSRAVTEDGTLTASGRLTITDADAGQATFIAQSGTSGNFGSFSISAVGNWTYTLANASTAVQALAAGETRTETFTVMSADGTPTTITITLSGTNDLPTISGTFSSAVAEDGTLTASGVLAVTDADAGQSTFIAQSGTSGTYGSFSMTAAGTWTYTLDNASTAVQALAAGETRFETFNIRSADGSQRQIEIRVAGAADRPTISGSLVGAVTEDTTLTATGTLSISDPDAGQSSFMAQTNVVTTYGSFSVTAQGVWTYTLNNSAVYVQSIAPGSTRTDTFNVRSADGTTSTVTVTISGTNDVPTITGTATGAITEDASSNMVSGNLTITDPDAGQSYFATQSGTAGTYGRFYINATGRWDYVLNNSNPAVQALAAGETRTETFTVTSQDSSATQTVEITITGTNDVPTISGSVSGAVTEDGMLTASGRLTITDADAGQANFLAQTATSGTYGSFSITSAGAWTYTLDNASPVVQALRSGDTRTETFTVASADGTTRQVTVAVSGTNDAPVVTAINAGTIDENAGVKIINLLAGQTDAEGDRIGPTGIRVFDDLGEPVTFSNNGNGTISIDPGQFSALNTGESRTLTVTYNVSDGSASTTNTATLIVTGVSNNSAPVLAGSVAAQSVAEDTAWSYMLPAGLFTDPNGDTLTITATLADGSVLPSWLSFNGVSFSGTPPLNFNGAIDIRLIAADPSGANVSTGFTLTVTPVNDAPTISGALSGDVAEDGTLTASGVLTISDADADAGQSTFLAQTATSGNYGSFSIDATGNWTYTLDNASTAVQALGANDTRIDSFTVTSADGTTSQVNVTVNGTNDVATIGGTNYGSVREDTVTTASGVLTIADADQGQLSFVAQSGTRGTYGSFSVNTAGTWTYALDNASTAVQLLSGGETRQDRFFVSSNDGTTLQIRVFVAGTNDEPTISGAVTGAVTEDGATNIATGALTISDADEGQARFVAQASTSGTYGSFSITAEGTWTNTLDNASTAVQALAAGETRTETFTVTSWDGTTTTVTITLSGTNDLPTITGTFSGAVTEDATQTASGVLTISDADAGQSTFVAQSGTSGTYGSFSITSAGVWTYTLDNANPVVQALGAGETRFETFNIRSADGSQRQIEIRVAGAADRPTISGSVVGAVTEDTALTATGTLSISDPDAGQSSFMAQTNVVTTYGSFSVTSGGVWTYTLNNSAVYVQSIAPGSTRTDTFNVRSVDGTTSTVTVTISGTNDVPTITGTSTGAITENASSSFVSGNLTISDPDAGQSYFATQSGTAGTYGRFYIDATGRWNYGITNSSPAVQALAAGETRTETFTATSQDGSATQTVEITVIGANDVPTVTGIPYGAVTEDGTLTTSGVLTISDADAGQANFLAQTATSGTYGSFSITSEGAWTYTLDNASPAVQALTAGATRSDNFIITSADGTSWQVSVAVHGANENPVVTAVAVNAVPPDEDVLSNAAQTSLRLADAPDTDPSLADADQTFTVSSDSFDPVEGGSGFDTLTLDGSDILLDFTQFDSGDVAAIEAIDLTGSGDNGIVIALTDVLDMSGSVDGGISSLIVKGDDGDHVELAGAGWQSLGTETHGGVDYTVFGNDTSRLLIDDHVAVAAAA